MFTKYIDTFLSLLERFVTAHEAIAAARSGSAASTPSRDSGNTNESASDTGRRGRTRNTENTAPPVEEQQTDTGGRRQRQRAGGSETSNDDSGNAGSGRRQRQRAGGSETSNENKPPELTPEQKNLLADIEANVQLCGDLDEAAADVKAYFKENGWSGASDIPADSLEDALDETTRIADIYFEG